MSDSRIKDYLLNQQELIDEDWEEDKAQIRITIVTCLAIAAGLVIPTLWFCSLWFLALGMIVLLTGICFASYYWLRHEIKQRICTFLEAWCSQAIFEIEFQAMEDSLD